MKVWLCTMAIVLLSATVRATESDPAGLAIVAAIDARDSDQLEKLIDSRAMGERIINDLGLSSEEKEDFMKGYDRGVTRISSALMQQFEQSNPKLKLIRTVTRQGNRHHLIRFDMMEREMGYNYIEFETSPDNRIIDWYSHGQGKSATGMMRQSITTMLGNENLLVKAAVIKNPDPQIIRAFRRFTEHVLEGKHTLAYIALEQLPDEYKQTQDWAALRVQLAGQIDEQTYHEALDFLATKFGDVPELQFLLIDYYYLQQKHAEAIRALTAFEQFVGEDGVTSYLKCNMYLEIEQFAEATQACQHGIDLEPDQEILYWLLVSIGLKNQQPHVALTALSQYEAAFQKQFDPDALAKEPTYQDLAKTPEYQRWAAERRGVSEGESDIEH